MKFKKVKYFHAIKLVEENCTGCTKCVRVCPTEALRVRDGVVKLDSNRCVDCGKCVAACPFGAIQTVADDISSIHKFKYKLAIISTSFAGQFPSNIGYKTAKKTLLKIGFDAVAEEAMVTVKMSSMIRDYIEKNKFTRPIISSNCPSIVRLIQFRFPSLLPNILHLEAPMSMLSVYFRKKICEEQNLKEDEVGIFLIVPCISQVTAVHQPEGTYKNLEDGAISIQDIYSEVVTKLMEDGNQTDDEDIDIYPKGLSWAISGMEAEEVNDGSLKTMAVSGVNNAIKILAKIENQQIENYDYIVMNSCTNGCVGGVLNIEDTFVATSRIRSLLRKAENKEFNDKYFEDMYHQGKFNVPVLDPRPIMTLDEDIKIALSKMNQINDITKQLPGLDCSACGSPTCKTLAEDIVENKAQMSDCVILLKKEQHSTSIKKN
jgi:Na+-translocating ferredoxin:NAD+ oxidoreductase RNF subunit RnfB/protein-tyrosine-phosphatase